MPALPSLSFFSILKFYLNLASGMLISYSLILLSHSLWSHCVVRHLGGEPSNWSSPRGGPGPLTPFPLVLFKYAPVELQLPLSL